VLSQKRNYYHPSDQGSTRCVYSSTLRSLRRCQLWKTQKHITGRVDPYYCKKKLQYLIVTQRNFIVLNLIIAVEIESFLSLALMQAGKLCIWSGRERREKWCWRREMRRWGASKLKRPRIPHFPFWNCAVSWRGFVAAPRGPSSTISLLPSRRPFLQLDSSLLMLTLQHHVNATSFIIEWLVNKQALLRLVGSEPIFKTCFFKNWMNQDHASMVSNRSRTFFSSNGGTVVVSKIFAHPFQRNGSFLCPYRFGFL